MEQKPNTMAAFAEHCAHVRMEKTSSMRMCTPCAQEVWLGRLLHRGAGQHLWQHSTRGFLFPTNVGVSSRAVSPRVGHVAAGSQLRLLRSSHIVLAAELGKHPLKWLFVKKMCDLKWSLTSFGPLLCHPAL